jgi:hypothetical protein
MGLAKFWEFWSVCKNSKMPVSIKKRQNLKIFDIFAKNRHFLSNNLNRHLCKHLEPIKNFGIFS